MSAIVGVVPNFSEGRRRDVIDAIVDALKVDGARVVYAEADPDHHRLDTTVLGDADAVRRSAIAGTAEAVKRIDMFEHRGGHPRMGAADVIPFMPVRETGMQECVALAREVGRELAESLGLPVYLYGEAALVPERRSLADVRKGEFEGLREALAVGDRLPDFGPHEIGPPARPPSGRASRWWRSTCICPERTRRRRRTSLAPSESPREDSRPCARSGSRSRSGAR